MDVDPGVFSSALKRMIEIGGKDAKLTMKLGVEESIGHAVLGVNVTEVGEATEEVGCSYRVHKGKDEERPFQLEIAVNPVYLRESIERVKGEEVVTLYLQDSVRPILIETQEGEIRITQLLMPLHPDRM